MVKEAKFFRKQAAKSERMARIISDAEISERFLNMARAYRSQADVLKAKKKEPRLKAKKPKVKKLKVGKPNAKQRTRKKSGAGRSSKEP